MFSDFSSNVTLAKTRAMFGRRIKKTDYDALLNCKSVFEIASYLKHNTAYSKTLANINESEIHRAELEAVIRNKPLDDLATLLRYEIASGDALANYLIAKAEIEQIVHALVHLAAPHHCEAFRIVPTLLAKNSKIKMSFLFNAKTFEELLGALRNSPYKKLLKDLKVDTDGKFNLTEAEYILYNYLYSILFNSFNKIADKKAREQLNSIFKTYINFGNFVRIVRNRRHKNNFNDFIVLNYGSIPDTHLENMLSATTEDEIFKIMKSIPQGYMLKRIEHNYLEQIPLIALYQKCRHAVYFSTNTQVILNAYIFLMENELYNVIKIIEGIRYSLPKDEIFKLLIL